MNSAETLVLLLMLVAALVVAAERIRLPYPVVLVIAGLALSFTSHLPVMKLNPEIVFYFFLPALIYPAALFTSWRDFRRNLRPILLLAIGLVLMTMVSVAFITHALVPSIPLAAAFALGAIVSPPDAIAATAVIRRLSVPRRIGTILEGESLVNDATALVALQFAIVALTTGHFSLALSAGQFVVKGAGSVLFGLGVSWVIREIHRHLDDPPIQITISLLTPFVTYLPAERLHLSGVLAVVASGIYLGWHSPTIVSARYRLQSAVFWQMVVFLLNGFVFISIGLQLPGILRDLAGESLRSLVRDAAIISLVVIAVRILWVICATYIPRLLSKKLRKRDPLPPWRQVVLLAWSGMRGVVSLAAAFALPIVLPNGTRFPGRNYILFFTFAIILATLVLQGLTLPVVIRALGLRDDGKTDEEERSARLAANKAALQFIRQLCQKAAAPDEVLDRLRAEYDDRMQELEACCGDIDNPSGEIATPRYQDLQNQALQVERRTIIQLRNEQIINDEALRRIQRDLDLAEARLTGF
jgi:CPA1 family monovalent cation:H+ antiporter